MKEEKPTSGKNITVELKVYMHCDACERLVFRTLKKVKGVDTVTVDRDEHMATLTGHFKFEKVLHKIKKKTGKKAEIVRKTEESAKEQKEDTVPVPSDNNDNDHDNGNGNLVLEQAAIVEHEFHELEVRQDFDYFNDENTDACRIM